MVQEFITAGKIVGAHGVRGEVKLLPQVMNPHRAASYLPIKITVPRMCRQPAGNQRGSCSSNSRE